MIDYEKLWRKLRKELKKYIQKNNERIENVQDETVSFWFYKGKGEFAELVVNSMKTLEERAIEKSE